MSPEDRQRLAAIERRLQRDYPVIYPTWPRDPECRCCHPNDRPYCACPCHQPVAVRAVAVQAPQVVRPAAAPHVPTVPAAPLPRLSAPAAGRPGLPDYDAVARGEGT